MTIIDRYLTAVGENLPRGQRDDILRELADDIRARGEDRADALGRPLRPEEQADILRALGEPMAVAARYRSPDHGLAFGRRLVGPELFPGYLRVLGINLTITAAVGVILAIVGVRDGFAGAAFGVAVTFLIQFLLVTVVFVLIDRRYISHPPAWDPLADPTGYPAERILDDLAGGSGAQPLRVSRIRSAVSLGWLIIMLVWWLSLPAIVTSVTPLAPGPGWTSVSAAVLGLFVIWFVQPIVNLVRPDWVRFRSVALIVGEVATIALAAVSLSIGDWLVIADPATAPSGADDLEGLLEGVIGISLVGVILVSTASIAGAVRGLVRGRRRDGKAPAGDTGTRPTGAG